MKAEDLMVGNWVYFKNSKHPSKVDINDFKFSFEWATPIPLTEENIIELLGFEPVKGITGLYVNKKGVEVDFDCYTVKFPNIVKRIKIPKHVHKLQQLIKALEE